MAVQRKSLGLKEAFAKVAKKIEKLQRDFFWGDGIEKRKIHSIDWDSLCKSKKAGGLGIEHIMDKNRGLMAKWVWRFDLEVSSLWKKVICATYGLDTKPLQWNWQGRSKAPHFVKAIRSLFTQGSKTKQVLKGGLNVVIGYGNRVRFWHDLSHDGIPLSQQELEMNDEVKKKPPDPKLNVIRAHA
ncbi:hypothetical protein Dsin_013578 [Dipteronia sinensis]|uniref:Uncharacterized protein n=1 Tax=Dipteronia sinensis TaxID=43782 RepID=A0AAE0E905_9ROSI|nr:hypothetical protein Dsin_013578 [Dipteronia sinensis]